MKRILITCLCLGVMGNVFADLTKKENDILELSSIEVRVCFATQDLVKAFVGLKEHRASKEYVLAKYGKNRNVVSFINTVYDTDYVSKDEFLKDFLMSCLNDAKDKIKLRFANQ